MGAGRDWAATGLLDVLDEAAIEPGFWPEALGRVFDAVGAAGGAILSATERLGMWSRVDPTATSIFLDRFVGSNPIQDGIDRLRTSGDGPPDIVTDRLLMDRSQFVRTSFYNDFMRPFGGHSMMVIDISRGARTAALNINRPLGWDEFSPADARAMEDLRPHLARAFWLGLRLAERGHAEAGVATFFDGAAQALFLLASHGEVRRLNPAAEALLRRGAGLRLTRGRLSAAGADDNRRMQAMIARAGLGDQERRRSGTMSIGAPDRLLPLTVTATPIHATRFVDVVGEPSVLLCVDDPEAPLGLTEDRIRDAFGLSAAEARVALTLCDGLTPRETAEALGVSFYTVRGQLMSIFRKTGARRQAELVRLFTRLAGL